MLKINEKLGAPTLTGHVAVWATDLSGRSRLLHKQDNLVVYQGATILAKALSGDTRYRVSHMYIQFTNTTVAASVPSAGDTRALYEGLESADVNYARLPLSQAPTFLSETSYVDNIVTFTATKTNTDSEDQLDHVSHASFSAGTSFITDAALVCAVSSTSASSDLLYSRIQFAEVIPTSASYQISIIWGIKFNTPT